MAYGEPDESGGSGLLTEDAAEARIAERCFRTGPPRRVGVELEWLVHDRDDPRSALSAERLTGAVAPLEPPGGLPGGSALTREPGGQLELSSAPADSLNECLAAVAADLEVLRQAVESSGLRLVGRGVDDIRPLGRVLDHPRYRAMESFFARSGPWGRVMMCGTASVQVSLDSGDDTADTSGFRLRWELAHRLGPVLVAAFANSPFWRGRPSGWRSTRQAVWARLDPGRTRTPRGGDPRTAWARYALDAELMCLRRSGTDWAAPPGLSFRAWLRDPRGERPPTAGDLDYHLSTLFPPVRPRGWLELRMIDAQPGDGWIVPTAVAAALLDDPLAADAALAATESLAPPGEPPATAVWLRAARLGPAAPELGKAVRACFTAAEAALARARVSAGVRDAVDRFAERYADRDRCPADDLLDTVRRNTAAAHRKETK
ncbi:ergothioneine biosynthesis glutamate--cysteine ligase EgtA [Streptomyces verrucosisporus]|uniref:ergothioneine biosynthesis glutamate--cysteine ligase EgtA n=1 Tax=Streptomyces verrucosisporus TaxID=1695161 RepID=UPI0019CF802E|nr:ergothioneine biosynthesis glutamate--cysteine ligase EgtA [Streptomyces verrucosisporus]MBN3931794.1 ergothioneine biosynthesis glutamate--cysteine ligase EgtA [Streptomyces verrucosisporus]